MILFVQTSDVIELAIMIGVMAIVVLVMIFIFNRALRRVNEGAARFAKGDLNQRLYIRNPPQVAALADALNRMAEQLEQRLHTVIQQRNELDAVLSSMTEGVMAVDDDLHILSLNAMGARLLGIQAPDALGRDIYEMIHDATMQQFIADMQTQNSPTQVEVSINHTADRPRRLRLQGTALRDADDKRIGALIVMQDITRLHQLEQVRRDFVANVSHEIKTPVSAIRAAAETVLEDCERGQGDPEPMLRIIARQSERLQAIVEDLLSLARIEQESESQSIDLTDAKVTTVLQAAVETCKVQADAKQTVIALDCDDALHAPINQPLLEQAVVNLLDNAIKYGPEKSTVTLQAKVTEDETIISVTDQGLGIGAEHLPRIFERFYRTDRARSRALGGTGLGLAIVKHITQAHGGRVSVDSTPNQGSTFRIHLPNA